MSLIAACSHPPQLDYTPTPANTVLKHAQNISRHSDTLFLISDFAHWGNELQPTLAALAETRTVIAIQILDKGEQSLTDIGKLQIRSPYDGKTLIIDTHNTALRQRYEQAMRDKQQQLTQLLQECAIKHHTVTTECNIAQTLAAIL